MQVYMCDFELRFLVLSCPLKRNVALVSLSGGCSGTKVN
jgi:hypothetical protein